MHNLRIVNTGIFGSIKQILKILLGGIMMVRIVNGINTENGQGKQNSMQMPKGANSAFKLPVLGDAEYEDMQ